MKKPLLLLLLCLPIVSYAQQNKFEKGTILYETYLNTDIKKDLNNVSKEISAEVFKLLKNAKKINCILKFDNSKALFSLEYSMENDLEKGVNISKIGLQGVYYTDILKKEIIHQNESFGKLFLISKKPVKWNLTHEKQYIGKYLCFKATAEIKGENRNGFFTKKIIAWYAIDIPLSFGPKYYSGLPGLIIKLQEGRRTYNLTKIDLDETENIIVKKPKEGKKVSSEEYHQIVKEIVLNRNKMKY